MKMLILVLLLILAFILTWIAAGQFGLLQGKAPQDLGVTNHLLKAPSRTENSISSQADLHDPQTYEVQYALIPPFPYKQEGSAALARLQKIIQENFPEARLVQSAPNYLRYEFTTRLLKYIDDVEFYMSEKEFVIHVRSASRLGLKDLGKNRERIEAIRHLYFQ